MRWDWLYWHRGKPPPALTQCLYREALILQKFMCDYGNQLSAGSVLALDKLNLKICPRDCFLYFSKLMTESSQQVIPKNKWQGCSDNWKHVQSATFHHTGLMLSYKNKEWEPLKQNKPPEKTHTYGIQWRRLTIRGIQSHHWEWYVLVHVIVLATLYTSAPPESSSGP